MYDMLFEPNKRMANVSSLQAVRLYLELILYTDEKVALNFLKHSIESFLFLFNSPYERLYVCKW